MSALTDSPIILRVLLGLLGAAMVYVTACRMVHTSKARTLARIRAAIVVMGAAGGLMVLAATARPDWIGAASVAGPVALLAWMAATAHAWRDHQPLSAARGGAVVRRPHLAVAAGGQADRRRAARG